MSKKLNVSELNVLSNVIRDRVNKIKYEKIEGKLEKDSDYKKLSRLSKEINELNKKINEKNKVYSEICLKVRNKFNISNIMKSGDNVKVYFNENNYNEIYNDLILMNIGKSVDIDNVINEIIKKYS